MQVQCLLKNCSVELTLSTWARHVQDEHDFELKSTTIVRLQDAKTESTPSAPPVETHTPTETSDATSTHTLTETPDATSTETPTETPDAGSPGAPVTSEACTADWMTEAQREVEDAVSGGKLDGALLSVSNWLKWCSDVALRNKVLAAAKDYIDAQIEAEPPVDDVVQTLADTAPLLATFLKRLDDRIKALEPTKSSQQPPAHSLIRVGCYGANCNSHRYTKGAIYKTCADTGADTRKLVNYQGYISNNFCFQPGHFHRATLPETIVWFLNGIIAEESTA